MLLQDAGLGDRAFGVVAARRQQLDGHDEAAARQLARDHMGIRPGCHPPFLPVLRVICKYPAQPAGVGVRS